MFFRHKRSKKITTRSSYYNFTYDIYGNTSTVGVSGRRLASYEYNANNGKLSVLTYGNGNKKGDKVKYVYDSLDRISQIQYNVGVNNAFETVYAYDYDSCGNLYSVTDYRTGEVTMYRYDLAGKLINSYVYDSDTMRNLSGTMMQYDKESRLSGVDYCYDYTYSGGIADVKDSYSYIYDETTGNISRVNIHGAGARGALSYSFDKFYRAQSKTVSLLVGNTDVFYNHITYDYVNSPDTSGGVHLNESGLVSQYKSTVKQSENGDEISSATYNYTYDDRGNITGIRNGSNEIQNKYYYDDLGQLIREDNLAKNATYVYTYDNAGNITSKKTYAFTVGTLGTATSTVNYTYGNSWGDLLTSYNGAPINYDAIGNPTSIDLDSLTWQGRELQTKIIK